jgi:predicted phosphodiesterase
MQKIHYISDLHLDYVGENELTKFYRLLNTKDLYIISGDFYNDYRKSLKVVQYLEKHKIHGYWVLGNHEYIHLNEPGNVDPNHRILDDHLHKVESEAKYDKFLKLIIDKTKNYKNFIFLHTGTIKNINKEWKIIGDTGWMNLKNTNKKVIDYKIHEWNHLNNWNWIFKQNENWIKYANACIKKYDKLIIVTHHPMYFPALTDIKNSRLKEKGDEEILFWYSNTKIKVEKNKKIIFIHGHTHTEPFAKNHYTNAIGRKSERKILALKTLNI